MTTLSTTEAQENFPELLRRVAVDKERIILTRDGEEFVAVVPIEDLALVEALENRVDLEEAREALRKDREQAVKKLLELARNTTSRSGGCRRTREELHEPDVLEESEHPSVPTSREPFAALRALSGTAHSDFRDISTDKYPHVGIGRPR